MNLPDRIEINPDVLTGKPVVKGTRISVELIMELLSEEWAIEEILDNYPALDREDVYACLRYATEALKSERVYPVATDPEG
ncbi:MAG: DUF433 domain-containing protein [Bacteroidetes bacterium]|jgi:uncharacterized protein (DUF433 family)|nr:DUF433 domain-containing protein [Bacteroidota bacterium]